jgi:hypothetical protein
MKAREHCSGSTETRHGTARSCATTGLGSMTERTLMTIFMTISRFVFTMNLIVFFFTPNDGESLRCHAASYDLALIT